MANVSDNLVTAISVEQGENPLNKIAAISQDAQQPNHGPLSSVEDPPPPYTAPNEHPQEQRARVKVDMDAHMGIRGIASVWIVIFHCLIFSRAKLDIQGSALMTVFFLLSGFALAVVYGPHLGTEASCSFYFFFPLSCAWDNFSRNTWKQEWGRFYQNRLARIMPGYWFANLLAIGTVWVGWGNISQANVAQEDYVIRTVVGIVTGTFVWAPGGLGWSLSGPAWTVSCLLFCYVFFPSICQWYTSQMSGPNNFPSKAVIFGLFICQFVVAIILIVVTGNFYIATMTPYSRLPVFVIGVIAGLDCVRNGPHIDPGSYSFWGWICHCCCHHEQTISAGNSSINMTPQHEKKWAGRVDRACLIWCIFFVYFLVIDSISQTTGDSCENLIVFCGGAFWLQIFFGVYPLLEIAVGLTRDGGQSWTSKLLRLKIAQWLGTISYSVYLVHEPLISYFHAIYFANEKYDYNDYLEHKEIFDTQTAGESGQSLDWNEGTTVPMSDFTRGTNQELGTMMPWWGVLVITPISLFIGWVATKYVEAPARKILSAKKR